ncbi:MAG: DUF2309 domain-containing protein [Gemmatimonadota bacterium]
MTQLAVREAEARPSRRVAPAADADQLLEVLAELHRVVPPMWPLADFAAVNPFAGVTHRRFLEVRQAHRELRDCDLLMDGAHFRSLLADGRITRGDLVKGYRSCAQAYPEWYAEMGLADVEAWVEHPEGVTGTNPDARGPRYRTVAAVVDARAGTSWERAIANEVGRQCEAHFDGGQAQWSSPWTGLPLFAAWRARARFDRRLQQLGMTALDDVVTGLADRPAEALQELLGELGVPSERRRGLVLAQAMSVFGWASYIRHRVGDASASDDDLVGLVAIRLAYDVALFRSRGALEDRRELWPHSDDAEPSASRPSQPDLVRLVLQAARETAYRRDLLAALGPPDGDAVSGPAERKLAQMVFCIDVRSEVMRRHLESLGGDIDTSGFAGFFGIPMAYLPLGESEPVAQCPVLVEPSLRVRESTGPDARENARALARRRSTRLTRKVWKGFQSSAASCFSFVESVGLLYVGKLISSTLGITPAAGRTRFDGIEGGLRERLGPDLEVGLDPDLTLEARADLAEAMLRNLGCTDDFARLVVLCGHGTDLVNNPYAAAYQCGACGGHSGEVNARFGAKLLNEPNVRRALAMRGIEIPDDTWFLAAVHLTTSDEIVFHDTHALPSAFRSALDELRSRVKRAGELTRLERSARIPNASAGDLPRRARDWAELRPEWGLAGNAAFIVAPRHRTRGVDLGGRAFLHDYDPRKDPDGRVLELIMTAPMIVTSWINLQYYASTVDNRAFGAGNKVIHNVTGHIGVVQGNGGDLATGLPWQAVSDGERLQHEPLRLSVLIEAPRDRVESILERHESVRDLVTNDWLTLIVLDSEGQASRWTSHGTWELVEPT